ncbi:MAG: sugar ABC transporter permease [Clostridia bacterium]|nr:sugar ABC transporter permease [Clostridia bacterium]
MQHKQRAASKRRRRGLSESQLAVLLVLPALAIIACIAVYPILRTIWYSLFDLRLNHPTRNTPHFSYSLDLEKYADGMYTFASQTAKALAAADTEEETLAVQALIQAVEAVEEALFDTDERREKLLEVNALIDAYKPVNDDELRYIEVSQAEIARYKDDLAAAKELAAAAKTAASGAAKQIEKAAQALDALDFAAVEPNFVGLKNYQKYLGDARLWTSVANTTIFTVFAVSFELIVGLLLALLMNQSFRGRGLIRASVLIPWSIPASTSAIIWKFMYDGQYGIMSSLLASLGIIPSASYILTTRAGSLFGMILSDIWKTSPFMALLLLAGLQTIDTTLYEAAKVDGCSRIRSFFSITLPLLKPTILVSVLFRTMDTFKAFDLPSVMTNGANDTESISLYAYKLMFAQMDFGSGSTVSIILFFMVFLICLFYIKVMGADVFKSSKA